MGLPQMRTLPPSIGSSPAKAFNIVLLPLPFGPNKAISLPAAAPKVTPLTAFFFP